MAAPLQRTALQAVKRFRARELAGLMGHLRVFGPLPEPPASTPQKNKVGDNIVLPNPFLPKKNPKTGKWRPPKYSLRRQAELVKMAKASGTLASLPPGPKKFAAELRMERVNASLSASTLAQLAAKPTQATSTKPKTAKKRLTSTQRMRALQDEIAVAHEQLLEEREKLKTATSAYDLSELSVFEGVGKEDAVKRAEHRAEQTQRAEEKEALEAKVRDLEKLISANEKTIDSIRTMILKKREIKKAAINWNKVIWAGEAKPKAVAGVESGTRLYAGKKRMFKGHLWERKRARRIRRHTILMRDMATRIERYKNYYKKRRPNPLKPSRYTKPPKLPF